MSAAGAARLPARMLGKRGFVDTFLKYKERYFFLIPGIALFVIFRYIPMAGIVLAWRKFTITGGLFGGPWEGWKYFERLFTAPDFGP